MKRDAPLHPAMIRYCEKCKVAYQPKNPNRATKYCARCRESMQKEWKDKRRK